MTLCFDSVRHKLTHKIGFFDLLGFDFMVDTDYNVSPHTRGQTVPLQLLCLPPQVWLIEVNINPAMHTNCDTLLSIIPPVIEETLGENLTLRVCVQYNFLYWYMANPPGTANPLCMHGPFSPDLAVEVFDKCRRSKPVLPLTSLKSFVPLVT